MFGYQGQERVSNSTNDVGGSRWYNFQLRMYNPALGRFNTIDPYSQFNSPYLAMANNPISYVDPDGGRAILTENQKNRILRNLRMNSKDYTRREWLAIWLSTSGADSYRGMTLEGLNAAVQQFGVYGYNSYLDIDCNCADGPGGSFQDSYNLKVPSGADPFKQFGNYIDGLKVSGFGFELFIANTLREEVAGVENTKGLSNQDILNRFGSGETNYDRQKRLAREASEYNNTKKAKIKEKRTLEKIEKDDPELYAFLITNFYAKLRPDKVNLGNKPVTGFLGWFKYIHINEGSDKYGRIHLGDVVNSSTLPKKNWFEKIFSPMTTDYASGISEFTGGHKVRWLITSRDFFNGRKYNPDLYINYIIDEKHKGVNKWSIYGKNYGVGTVISLSFYNKNLFNWAKNYIWSYPK